jgi:hypothetical protein
MIVYFRIVLYYKTNQIVLSCHLEICKHFLKVSVSQSRHRRRNCFFWKKVLKIPTALLTNKNIINLSMRDNVLDNTVPVDIIYISEVN